MKRLTTALGVIFLISIASVYGQGSSDPGRFEALTDWDTIYVQKNPATNLYYADTVQFYEIYSDEEGSITIEFIDQFILEKNRDFLQVFDALIQPESFFSDMDQNQVKRDSLIANGTLRTPQKEGRGLDFENQIPDPITSNKTIPTGQSNLLLRFSSFDDGNQNEGWTVRYRRNVGTPDLKVTEFSVDSISASGIFDSAQGLVAVPGDDVQITSEVSNVSYQSFVGGNALAGGSFIGYYFISEAVRNEPYETIIDDTRDDVYFLGEQTMPAIPGSLEEQEPVIRRPSYSIPTDGVEPGTWYLVAIADHKDQINEGNDEITGIDGLDNVSFLSIEIPKLQISGLQDTQISTGPLSDDLEFSVETNIQWSTEIQGDWLGLDTEAGSKATSGEVVTINWSPNDTDNPRIGTVTFAGNPEYWYVDKVPTTTLVVTQERPKLLLDKSFVNLDSEAGTFTVGVSTNLNYRVITNDSDPDWLSIDDEGVIQPFAGDQNVQLTFDYDVRDIPIERTTSIEIQGILNSDEQNPQIVVSRIITITQQGEPVILNSVPVELDPLSAAGETVTIRVNSNTNWIIEENAQWLSIDPLVGGAESITDVNITAKENPSPQERKTNVLIQSAGNEEFVVIDISQEGSDPLLDINRGELDDSLEFLGGGEEENDGARIFLQTNLNWTIAVLPTNENNIPIFEDDLGRPTENIVPENQPVPPARWVTLEHTEGGPAEDLSIEIEVLPNIHTDSRYAIILAEGESPDGSIFLRDTLFITQETGQDLIFWGINSIPITSSADNLTVKVVGDELHIYEVSGLFLDGGETNQIIAEEDSIASTSWIQFELLSPRSPSVPFEGDIGSNNFDEVEISWDENSNNVARSAILIVESRFSSEVNDTLRIFQRPKVITLNVDQNLVVVGKEAGQDSVTILSSDISAIDLSDITVDYDGAPTQWITIDTLIQDTGVLRFSYAENLDVADRSAIILIEVSGNQERVRIDQRGELEFIDLDAENFVFPEQGDSTGYIVHSNFEWLVGTLATWLEVERVYLDEDNIPDAVSVVVDPNVSTDSRTAVVTLGNSDESVSFRFSVSQAGESVFFDVSPREIMLNAEDTLLNSAQVFTNVKWGIEVPEESSFLVENGGWLEISTDTVSNLILFEATANTSGLSRSALIPVVGEHTDELIQDLLILQNGLENEVVVLAIGSQMAQQNEIIDIPVRARSGFNSVTSIQFVLDWDPTHLTYRSVSQFQLPGLGNANFGSTQTNDGLLLVSWTDPNVFGVDVAPDETLFNLQFIVTRETQSKIEVDESAQAIVQVEITRKIGDNLVEVPAAFEDGFVISNSTSVETHTVRGSIETPRGVEVSDIDINLLDPTDLANPIDVTTTDEFGDYQITFNSLDLPDYVVSPVSDNSMISQGISTFDILLIRQHILLQNREATRQYAYQVIASDVDNSGSVSTIDILYLRKIILEFDFDEMPNGGPSWKYVSTATDISNFVDPFAEIENPDVLGVADDNANFIAVKIGDPSFDALGFSGTGRAASEDFELMARTVDENDEFLEVEIATVHTQRIIGLQFEMQFDTEILIFEDLTSEIINETNYSVKEKGAIRVSWDDKKLSGATAQESFARLKFRKTNASTPSEISFSPAYSEVISASFETLQMNSEILEFNRSLPLSVSENHEFAVYPNPTNGIVQFQVPSGTKVQEILVFDSSGRLMLKRGNSDSSSLQLDLTAVDDGIYFYRLKAGDTVFNGRIIKH